jgi:hypothetical protein
VLEHLWLGGPEHPAPWRYVELVLCRDVYHCTPSQLHQENLLVALQHLGMQGQEALVRDMHTSKYERIRRTRPKRG